MDRMSYRQIQEKFGIDKNKIYRRAKKLGIDTSKGVLISDFDKLGIIEKIDFEEHFDFFLGMP